LASATAPSAFPTLQSDEIVTQRATGTFEVKLLPLGIASAGDPPPYGRMSIDKQFSGDLEGTSAGEMLSAMSSVKGSAGYVAIEKVNGTLHGRRGTFVLQHSATMNRGAPSLSVTVIPDSGTEELTGLSGSLQIIVEGKKHSYLFDYSIEGAV
jgi:hypothetical protein